MSSAFPGMRQPQVRIVAMLTLAAMLGMHAWVFYKLRQRIGQGYPDFVAFYAVGQCVRRGLAPRLYALDVQAKLQREIAPTLTQRDKMFPWVHPPFEAIVLAPLALLSYQGAYWVWNAFSAIALAAFVILMLPFLPRLRGISRLLPFLCAFAFFPVFDCLAQGQDSIFLLLLLGLAFSSLKQGRDMRAGWWLGLGLFRFQLVLPMLAILAWQRKWKAISGTAMVAAGLAFVSAALMSWQGLLRYPQAVLTCNRLLQSSGAEWNRFMPNLRGVVDHFLGAGTVMGKVVIVAGSLALLALALWQGPRDTRRPSFDLSFSLAVVVSVLISYYLFPHDLTLLLLPLLLTAEWLCSPAVTGVARMLLLAATVLLFFSPIYFLLWFRYQRLSQLFWVIALLGAGLSLALRRGDERRAARAASSN